MSDSVRSQSGSRSALRHPEILIAPGITFVAVLLLLGVARVYDRLPVQPPDCTFRERLSIPCAGCGGTRSMKALSRGDITAAIRFHPAAVVGVCAAFLWFGRSLFRYRGGEEPRSPQQVNRDLLRGVIVVLSIVFLNWIYLIFFLP